MQRWDHNTGGELLMNDAINDKITNSLNLLAHMMKNNYKKGIAIPKFMPIQLIDPHDYMTTRWVGTVDDPMEVVDCSCGATIPVWDYMPEFGRCFKCMGKCNDCHQLLPITLLDAYYNADNEFRFYLCKTHNA